MTVTTPPPNFDHLLRLTDRRGTFEHACLAEPQPEHGYCTDDVARVLVVATREPDPEQTLNGLVGGAVRFLNAAQALTGACRNRMDSTGRWTDEPSTEDCWGRCVWGLGTAAAHSHVGIVRKLAVIQFERAAQERSVHPRAMAFAALGAAELLSARTPHRLRRFDRRTERRHRLAVARAATHLRERGPCRGDDRRRGCARRLDAAAARPGSVGLAGRIRNGRRPSVSHPCWGQRR